MNGSLPLPSWNICAMLGLFALAMNQRVAGFGPVLLAQLNVRGVVRKKPS
jgi:hypothetical protein